MLGGGSTDLAALQRKQNDVEVGTAYTKYLIAQLETFDLALGTELGVALASPTPEPKPQSAP